MEELSPFTSLPTCTTCADLSKERIKILEPKLEPSKLPLMFIEEIPTVEENKSGILGGRFWDTVGEFIKPFNVTLKDVYCTSIIKCRPKQNRYPYKQEVLNCFRYLVQEVNGIKPLLIVFFGKSCFKYFVHMGGFETFNKIFHTRLCQQTIVTYNPLSLIKNTDDYFKFKSILRRAIILTSNF